MNTNTSAQWLTVLEHPFTSRNLWHCFGVKGQWSVSQNPPVFTSWSQTPRPQPRPGDSRLLVRGRKWTRLSFEEIITEIIAFDVEIVATCSGFYGFKNAVLLAGDNFVVRSRNGTFLVGLEGIETVSPSRYGPPDTHLIRWTWQSNGRSELYVDDELVTSRNDVHAAKSFLLSKLWLGGVPKTQYPFPLIGTTRIIKFARISVMTRDSLANPLLSALEIDPAVGNDLTPRDKTVDPAHRQQHDLASFINQLMQDSSISRTDRAKIHRKAKILAESLADFLTDPKAGASDFAGRFSKLLKAFHKLSPRSFCETLTKLKDTQAEVYGAANVGNQRSTGGLDAKHPVVALLVEVQRIIDEFHEENCVGMSDATTTRFPDTNRTNSRLRQ